MKGKVKERLYKKTDYGQYHFSLKESAKYLGQAAFASISHISEMAAESYDSGKKKKT